MSLAQGHPYIAIPGPSAMPNRVLQAMHRPAPDIYDTRFHDMVAQITQDLKTVARTKHHVAMYIANGHGAWEAALANIVVPGDQILALKSGIFGEGWAAIAERLGATAERIDSGRQTPIDPAQVCARLKADKAHNITTVMAVQTDTSTSLRADIKMIREAIDEARHPALLMVDCIACLGCDRFEMDGWGVDIMVAGSQKGLMTPPGMAFVFFNDKAAKARHRLAQISPYWDWTMRAQPEEFYQYFYGTAPTHHLFGLNEALGMIAEEGIEQVWQRHETLAQAIWAAIEAWGQSGPIRPNVPNRTDRSHAVTAISIGAPHGTKLRQWVEQNCGVTLGIGLGMSSETDPNSDGNFRIGHMGHINAHMVLGALGAIESGMRALNIPFGAGALSAAAQICAQP